MINMSLKASAVILSLVSLSTFAQAEKLPKASPDFKPNVELAIKDNKASKETALCSSTAHDLTKNKKYKYDRFGFTQADYDAVKLSRIGDSGMTTVKLNGEARLRTGGTAWDTITVECAVGKNAVRSISVTVKK